METSFKLKRIKGIMTKMISEPRNISYENHLIGIEILNVYEYIDKY